VRSLKTKEI